MNFKPSFHFQNEVTIGGYLGTFDYEKTVLESIDKTKVIVKDLMNKNLRETNLKIDSQNLTKVYDQRFFNSSKDIFKMIRLL